MEQQKKNRPVHEIRVGFTRVAVWSNKMKDGREKLGLTLSRIFPRVKPDGSKSWGTTDSFGALDIPLLQKALDSAFVYMTAESATVSEQLDPEADELDRVASIHA